MKTRAIIGPAIVITLTLLTFSDLPAPVPQYSGLALALVAGLYALSCAVYPYRKCRACRGMGRHVSRGLFVGIRFCDRCDGKGLKLRAGRRLYNATRRHHKRIH